ncbi:unnamed protein product [Brachionus calyciflorus]|uniref:Uncharacterized protein n=1 Tax=Brachionus calyciflorus TaxID=104777 RepID=A0A813RCR9_9BILA|nr:unnamed protein product [Brachionus calyciflorus]
MDFESCSDCDDIDCFKLGIYISHDLIDRQRYQIEFNFERSNLRSIIEEIVVAEKVNFSCICGGYFTKLNGQVTTPDIYIFTGSNYNPKEEFLNNFLNIQFRDFEFDQLGTVAPQGVLAKKKVTMQNGKSAYVYFTYVYFSRSDNHKIQLLDTCDIEPCKIMYSYSNDLLYCSGWFANGGNILYDNRTPSTEFLEKYYQKGFRFPNNIFIPTSIDKRDINKIL